jgi:hypothetical protein
MAFVVRSERKIDLNSSQVNELGPGQYISQNIIKPKSPAKIPFGSITGRDQNTKKNNFPCVGSYDYDDRYEKYAKFIALQKEREKSMPLYKTLEKTFNNIAYSKILPELNKAGFGSVERRFKISDHSKEVPGPGTYTKEKSQLKNSMVEHQKSPNKIKNGSIKLTGSQNRVLTIPDRLHSYGYDVLLNGELVMNRDPDLNLKHNGIKNDKVGPGSYNLDKSEDWIKNSLSWAKTSPKNKIKHKKIDFNNMETSLVSNNPTNLNSTLANSNVISSLDNSKSANESLNKKPYDKLSREKIFRQIKENRKKLLDKLNEKDPRDLNFDDKKFFSETPGPAYYSVYAHENKKIIKPEKFQIFGSSSPRFPTKADNEENEMGPGFYFRDDMNSRYEKSKTNQMKPQIGNQFNTKKKQEKFDKIKKEKEDMIFNNGPGMYDPYIPTKRSLSCLENFGSLEKRFPKKSDEIQIGPGSYSINDGLNLNKSQEKKDHVRKFYSSLKKDKVKDTSFEKEKSEVPPVGTYNSDLVYSMGYIANQKTNPYQSVVAPFSSMQKRFEAQKTVDNNIGPGYYYKPKNEVPQQTFPPFKQGDDKYKSPIFNGPHLQPGPGNYDQNNYFDWNKKSFNILYI